MLAMATDLFVVAGERSALRPHDVAERYHSEEEHISSEALSSIMG